MNNLHQIRKTYATIALAAVVLMGFAPMIGMFLTKTVFWYLVSAGLVLGLLAVFYAWKKYRCPYCNEILRAREPMPDRCPHCGAKL